MGGGGGGGGQKSKNIVKDYLEWYSCRSDTEIEEFNTLYDDVLFTNLYWPNN